MNKCPRSNEITRKMFNEAVLVPVKSEDEGANSVSQGIYKICSNSSILSFQDKVLKDIHLKNQEQEGIFKGYHDC